MLKDKRVDGMKKIKNEDWFINDLMKIDNDGVHIYGDGDWFIDKNSPFNKKEHIVDAFYGLFFLISIVCLFSLIIIVLVFNIDEKYWILFGLPVIISIYGRKFTMCMYTLKPGYGLGNITSIM